MLRDIDIYELMIPTQSQIESAAPDQASLKAALKLAKPKSWPTLYRSADSALIWGECQGSGANPYRVAVDMSDLGAKCSCPSRKFPCKHAIGLMLLRNSGEDFTEASVETWISEWLGRRRKTVNQKDAGQGVGAGNGGGAGAQTEASGTPGKAGTRKSSTKGSLKAAKNEVDAPLSEEDIAKREAQRLKRETATRASITNGLLDLEAWITDQLSGGLPSLQADLTSRCRQIAARMVDAKAGSLASRIDEIPSRVLSLPASQRLDALTVELGNLVLLSRAWRSSDEPAPSLRRAVASSENRDAILADKDAPRKTSLWKVIGTRVQTRRDGLVSTETWLIDAKADRPCFALLLDFTPASAGKRSTGFSIGDTFDGTLAFYPSDYPLRAQIEARGPEPAGKGAHALPDQSTRTIPDQEKASGAAKCKAGEDAQGNEGRPSCSPISPMDAYAHALTKEPWLMTVPLRLPRGRIAAAEDGSLWWRGVEGSQTADSDQKPEGNAKHQGDNKSEEGHKSQEGNQPESSNELAIPLDAKELPSLMTGYILEECYVLWSGFSATLLSANAAIGEVFEHV